VVCNDPAGLGCKRGLHNLPVLQTRSRDCNNRLTQAIRVGQGAGVLASPVFERIAQPTRTPDGRRAPASTSPRLPRSAERCTLSTGISAASRPPPHSGARPELNLSRSPKLWTIVKPLALGDR
jgi:hypothetical protein